MVVPARSRLPPAGAMACGPGGYRLCDYLRLGLPFTAIVLISIITVASLKWPL